MQEGLCVLGASDVRRIYLSSLPLIIIRDFHYLA